MSADEVIFDLQDEVTALTQKVAQLEQRWQQEHDEAIEVHKDYERTTQRIADLERERDEAQAERDDLLRRATTADARPGLWQRRAEAAEAEQVIAERRLAAALRRLAGHHASAQEQGPEVCLHCGGIDMHYEDCRYG